MIVVKRNSALFGSEDSLVSLTLSKNTNKNGSRVREVLDWKEAFVRSIKCKC